MIFEIVVLGFMCGLIQLIDHLEESKKNPLTLLLFCFIMVPTFSQIIFLSLNLLD